MSPNEFFITWLSVWTIRLAMLALVVYVAVQATAALLVLLDKAPEGVLRRFLKRHGL